MSDKEKKVFFAYQGRRDGKADENVDAIKRAIAEYNKYQKTYVAKSWEDYSKTNFISQNILCAIRDCSVFAADLTYFNHNVLFELGYAIAKNKEVVVFLNEKIDGSTKRYHNSFLKDLKYQELINAASIQGALQNHLYNKGWMQKYVKIELLSPKAKEIFYIESKQPNQPSLDLTELLNMFTKENNLSLITENYSEVQYRPINWYFSNIYQAKITIIHFLGNNIEDYFMANAFNSFWAGIACGFDRSVLLIAPAKYKAPLDYYEIMIQYESSNHLIENAHEWLDKCMKEMPALDEVGLTKEGKGDEQGFNLLRLGVGYDVAEDEKEELLNYFVPTFSYERAKKSKTTIIIGRKGSGKSAICIKLADDFVEDKNIFVIDLKPESDDLLYNIDLSNLFKSKSAKRNFFFTVWKCVILSKLLVDINGKITRAKSSEIPLENWEQDIRTFYEEHSNYLRLNFLGIISRINKDYLDSKEPQKPDVLEHLYIHFIGPIKQVLAGYIQNMSNKKYCQIVILGDNLDRTWSADTDLSIQAEMILTLLEVKEKIIHELPNFEFKLRSVLFLRNDIFDYIRNKVNEPDKLVSSTHEINWEDYPSKLRELIENRFRKILDLDESIDLDQEVWGKFFELGKKDEHAFETISSIITKRPRDLIYFMTRLFESAVNNNHLKVNGDDLDFAIDSYTKHLNNSLIAEVRAIFPEIAEIISKLQVYHGGTLEYKVFCRIVKEFGYDKSKRERLVEELFDKGYMLGYDDKTQKPFSDIKKLKDKLKEKKWIFFKNKVYVIAHAKYYYIKNKRIKSF